MLENLIKAWQYFCNFIVQGLGSLNNGISNNQIITQKFLLFHSVSYILYLERWLHWTMKRLEWKKNNIKEKSEIAFKEINQRGWTFTIIILGAYSKVILLVLLSNFAQCPLPCARLNPVARIPWAPSTAQNLKVTLIEWLLNMLLIWWL